MTTKMAIIENLNLTDEWDKTFPKSEKINHRKVTFHNRYGITLAADLYTRKGSLWPFRSDRGMRSVWGCKGAGGRSVCANDGRTRLSYDRI